jgi:histidine triad (HIT) family protein
VMRDQGHKQVREEGCVFCQITAGNLPASRVYEDEATLAFMDLRQSNLGHILVIPRAHIPTLDLLPAAIGAALMNTVVLLTGALRHSLAPDGINLWQSNGIAAGQEVFHVHFHIFPRFTDDGHMRVYPTSPAEPPRQELDRLAARVRAGLPQR